MNSAISKFYGVSSIIGAVVYAFLGIGWAVTHGSTGINYQRMFLGIDNLTVSRLGIIGMLCFLITVWGFRHLVKTESKWTKVFFRIAVTCLVIQPISILLQYYFADPIKNVENPLVSLGFLLDWSSWLLFSISMIVFGVLIRTQSVFTRLLIFFIGLLTILTFITQGFLLGLIDRESVRESVLAYLNFPVSICWLLLGINLLRKSSKINDMNLMLPSK